MTYWFENPNAPLPFDPDDQTGVDFEPMRMPAWLKRLIAWIWQ